MSETKEAPVQDRGTWKIIFAAAILTEMATAKATGGNLPPGAVKNSVTKADRDCRLLQVVDGSVHLDTHGFDPDMEMDTFRSESDWIKIHQELSGRVMAARKRHYRTASISDDQQDRLVVATDAIYWLKLMPSDSGGEELNDHIVLANRGSRFDPIARIIEDTLINDI